MAFASGSCDRFCHELEGENILDDPRSAENSFLDGIEALGHMPDVVFCENNVAANAESNGNSNKRQEAAADNVLDLESLHSDSRGWTKSLKDLPAFSHTKLENKLVKNNRTMPDKIAPNAYRNMKKGYGLWKEGYVRSINFRQGKHCRKNSVIFGKSKS